MPLTIRILLGLIAGIALGTILSRTQSPLLGPLLDVAAPVGTLWLNALKVTIVPLVFSLLVTSVAGAQRTDTSSSMVGRTLITITALLFAGALMSVIISPILLNIWPLPTAAAQALRSGLSATHSSVAPVPPIADMLTSIIPTNAVAVAAEGAILPLVAFALAFGFALTRLTPASRLPLVAVLRTVADAMVVIVGWVIWLAPFGVFALAVRVGANGGGASAGALAHYLGITMTVGLIAIAILYPVALITNISLRRFAAGIASAQAVAAGTSSSLASLPAMVECAIQRLGVPERTAGLVLPLAVTLFRYTTPPINVAVGLWLAQLYGVEPTAWQIGLVAIVAILGNFAAVGLPGSINLFVTYVPICNVLGLPLEVLPLLLAIDALPDLLRTVGNVTGDLTLARIIGNSKVAQSNQPDDPLDHTAVAT